MITELERTRIKYFMSNDVAFKTFFRNNPKMLKKVISMSLRIKESEINSIIYLNNELSKDSPEDKLGIVDLLVEINNKKKINIEIQNVEKHNFKERAEFYLSKIYVEDLKRGEDYSNVKEVYGIFFLNYDDKNYPNFFSVIQSYDIINMKCTKSLKTMVVYNLSHIDEIDRYNFTEEEKDMLRFIKSKNEEELIDMAEKSMTLNEAMEQLRIINADEKLRQMLFYAELQRLDENTRKKYEREVEEKNRILVENNIKLEENTKKLENNNKKLENNNRKLKKNYKNLEINNQKLEKDNERQKLELEEKNLKIQTLINALHQNNSIEEVSKITNLEISYIKEILNL